jgi:hypothetical protein
VILDFFVVDPIAVFFTLTFFCVEEEIDERGKFSPLIDSPIRQKFDKQGSKN